MPMNPEAVLGLLSGILSIPKTWEDARNQQVMNNQMATLIGDASGQKITPPEPMGHFPGYEVPVLGSIERGIGTVGQTLQTALGHAPSAPRIDPSMLGMLLAQQRGQEGLNLRKQGMADREADVAARLDETKSNDAFRQSEAKSRDAERVSNETFQHGMMKSMDDERRERLAMQAEGSQPKDPALRAFMKEKPNATADELRTFEQSLKPGRAGANDPQANRGTLNPFKLFVQHHPEATNEDWSDFQASEAGKKAAAVQGAKPLPAPVQQTMSQMESIRTGLARMKDILLNDPDVAAGRGLVEGRFEQAMYTAGMAQKGEDPYLALQNIMKVVGAQPWMRNVRRYDMILDIRQHLPKAGDQKDLILSKIDNLDMFGIETEAQALKFAGASIGGIPGMEKDLEQQGAQYNLPKSGFEVPGAPGAAPAGATPAGPSPDTDWDAVRKHLGMTP